MPKPWLEELTLDKLHRLAVSLGTPCSGTKSVRIQGIRHAVSATKEKGTADEAKKTKTRTDRLSLLSIDMGIRNLAFAHLTAPASPSGLAMYATPTLQTWRHLVVSEPGKGASKAGSGSPDDGEGHASAQPQAPTSTSTSTSASTGKNELELDGKESFEPADFARHAYRLIKYMLQTYQPNQILIERQRFRSGGRAAVPEWTIRVGVFEGMLYSVLRTLVEEGGISLDVEAMQPTRVNRYWLESSETAVPLLSAKKMTGRDVKRAKIDLVGSMLESKSVNSKMSISKDLEPFAQNFLSSWKNARRSKQDKGVNITKLDDLADSLLQGLAWIDWQNHRKKVDALGRDAVDVASGSLL